MAKDWFEWNGESCKAYGIRVIEMPPITIAEERVNFEAVAGRSGSLAMLEGEDVYEDITLNCTCMLTDMSRLDDAMGWLKGSGKVTFANRPGGWYEARVVEQIAMDKIIAARESRQFPLSFRAAPYFYLEDADAITVTSASQVIRNPGNIGSAPRLTVRGTGTVHLELQGQVITLLNLSGGIILDSALQDALDLTGSELLNGSMQGDFFVIAPGASTLRWYADEQQPGGSISSIVIEPRWRCR